jgi:hypothetical protein
MFGYDTWIPMMPRLCLLAVISLGTLGLLVAGFRDDSSPLTVDTHAPSREAFSVKSTKADSTMTTVRKPSGGGLISSSADISGDFGVASSASLKADGISGRLPHSAIRSTDGLGRAEVRYDNGVTATTTPDPLGGATTRYSNGVTATTRPDPLGGSTTRFSNGVTATTRPDSLGGNSTYYSDGTRSTTRSDPLGNQVTTYSDGRTETVRPDPFAPAASGNGAKGGRK